MKERKTKRKTEEKGKKEKKKKRGKRCLLCVLTSVPCFGFEAQKKKRKTRKKQ